MKYFRKIFVSLVCLMLLGSQSFLVVAEDGYARGDVNGDGKITALDYVILAKYVNGQRQIDDEFLYACDVNGDGQIDEIDVERIKNMVYYGQVDNYDVSVASKDIHNRYQRSMLEEGAQSISKYNHGGYAPNPVVLEYDSNLISSGKTYTVKVSEKPDMSLAKTYTSSSRSIKILNPKVKQIYFWTVSNGTQTSPVQSYYIDDIPVRNLTIGTVENTRDIGGFETEDGFVVRQEMIYRGYMLDNDGYLSRNRKILKNDFGIKTEIDLAKCTILLNCENYYSLPVAFPIPNNYLMPGYSGANRNSIIQLFDVLADESNYPVYIHCHIGTDRTGLICFLLNALLGVSQEDCFKDYVFSTYSGNARTMDGLYNGYIRAIEAYEGRTFSDKLYNLLVKRGVNPDSLDSYISIMRQRKPDTKTYIDVPKAKEATLQYDGKLKQLKLSDDYLFNVMGDTAKDVGEYTATVSLKDPYTYSWKDGSKSDKTIAWRIVDDRDEINIPQFEIGEYTYDGEEVEIIIEENEAYQITGNKATDAGEYEIVISLLDKLNYVWSDGSNDDLTYSWSIEKADIDMSMMEFEDKVFEYDGTEKTYVYEGELPKGIRSIIYSDNTLIGDPDNTSSLEVTISFVLESDNYNEVEDVKSRLIVEPVQSSTNVSFEYDGLQPVSLINGQQYTLPELEKQDHVFLGWYEYNDGQFRQFNQEGIWNKDGLNNNRVLYPLFEYVDDVVTEKVNEDGSIVLTINETGQGIAGVVESDEALSQLDGEYRIVGIYQMNTNGYFRIDDSENKHFYLISDNQIIYDFNQE